ncbi:family 16 glycosylhydrolase [Pedobacter sp. P26]|uniref:family 16 glycosylhydrolase n=1 Tax=Pedobacter sp. P26 TaxID=3423956 RepID=UPI003D66F7CD
MKKTVMAFIATTQLLLSCKQEVLLPSSDSALKNTSYKILSAPSSATLSAPTSDYSLVWRDEFDGSGLNSNWWTLGFKDPGTGQLVPGAAGQYRLNSGYAGYVTSEDTYVTGGSLFLRNQKRSYTGTDPAGTYNYTSSSIMSMHKIYLNRGYIEFRAKMPVGDKVWPALWLVAEDRIWGPEIDIWEYFGYRPDQGYDAMGTHLMTGAYPNTTWYSHFIKPFNGTYNAGVFHVYGFEWTATQMKWYIDGTLVHTLNASGVVNWPDENCYFILNNGERTESPDNTTTWPNNVEIDYVRVYQIPISNPGFETGNASGWSTYGTTGIVNNNQNSGSYCARIGADNSGYEVTVSGLQPNTNYTFKGYVKLATTGNTCNIAVKNHGGSQVFASSSATTYQQVSVTFTTGATNHSATLCFYKYGGGSGAAFGDSFQVYAN